MLKIVYRPRAIAQIDAIADRTIAEWGESQASKYVADIRRQIEFAAEFPGIGSEALGLPSEYRKTRSGSHRVIYRFNENELIVIQIIHEREDVPDVLDGD